MTSESIRDPHKDQLLTPQDSALLIIDHQPVQVTSVASMGRRTLVTTDRSLPHLSGAGCASRRLRGLSGS
jgi:hypothetical protein